MSYNLLAKSLAHANPHLYPNCEPKALEWRHRSQRLLTELEALGSHTYDFYCLQEVDSDDFEQLFSPKFTKWGYTGFYKKRNGNKQDGCALFYRQQRVKALSLHAVNYNENKFIDRDNVGIVGLFEIQQGNETKRICIATTHILFSPARGMIKIAQLRMLLENAKQLIDREEANTPIIVCGDMNSLPQSTVLEYLTTENVNVSIMPETFLSGQTKGFPRIGSWDNKIGAFHEAFHDGDSSMISACKTTVVKSIISMDTPRLDGISESADSIRSVEALSIVETINAIRPVEGSSVGPIISQPFLLKSAYDISAPSRDSRGNNRARFGQPFTSYHAHCRQICDYIFYGHLRSAAHSPNAPKLELVACLELPCKEVERESGLPTPIFGSDHLSLVSKFRFV
ncbi:Protein angel 1 [Dissophora ornata]|nr:Protein angel 1 [Dissophora ornata]